MTSISLPVICAITTTFFLEYFFFLSGSVTVNNFSNFILPCFAGRDEPEFIVFLTSYSDTPLSFILSSACSIKIIGDKSIIMKFKVHTLVRSGR